MHEAALLVGSIHIPKVQQLLQNILWKGTQKDINTVCIQIVKGERQITKYNNLLCKSNPEGIPLHQMSKRI